MAGRVERVGVGLQIRSPFGLQRDREHLACGDAAQLVEVEGCGLRRGLVGVLDYPEHGVLLPAGVTRRFEIDYSGGYAASMSAVLIHNICLYLLGS
jgi:hypothetical protein